MYVDCIFFAKFVYSNRFFCFLFLFFMVLLGFSTIQQYHLQTKINFLFPFQFECLLILFLAYLAMISSTTLNSSESNILALFLMLEGKLFSLSPFSVMFIVGFSCMTSVILRCFPCVLSLLSVLKKRCEYCQIFFLH